MGRPELKTAIVTGGNSGLGYACVRALAAASGWHVVIAARDEARSAAAISAITRDVPQASVSTWPLNLGAISELPGKVAEFRACNYPPLHGLICNAGVQLACLGAKTAEGVEQTFGVNHLGHFALVNLLQPDFAAPARVIVVSSSTHDPSRRTGMPPPRFTSVRQMAYPDTDPAVDADAGLAARRAYATSKLCNVMFARQLDRRVRVRGITACSFDPGFMPGTGLSRSMPFAARVFFRGVLAPLCRIIPGAPTPQASGAALARLLSEADGDAMYGQYYNVAGETQPSLEARDAHKAATLWDESAEFMRSLGVGLVSL